MTAVYIADLTCHLQLAGLHSSVFLIQITVEAVTPFSTTPRPSGNLVDGLS
jgi:hypothetical protein